MKNNFKIIIYGMTILIFGIILAQNHYQGYSLFGIYIDTQLIGLLILSSAGLVLTGIGVMLEFALRKYSIPQ